MVRHGSGRVVFRGYRVLEDFVPSAGTLPPVFLGFSVPLAFSDLPHPISLRKAD